MCWRIMWMCEVQAPQFVVGATLRVFGMRFARDPRLVRIRYYSLLVLRRQPNVHHPNR